MGSQPPKRQASEMTSLKNILVGYDFEEKPKYISREFQDYGYRLAMELDDPKRASMYIKFAKTQDRSLLETARSFVKDAHNAKNKARLFMWKLKQLKNAKQEEESTK